MERMADNPSPTDPDIVRQRSISFPYGRVDLTDSGASHVQFEEWEYAEGDVPSGEDDTFSIGIVSVPRTVEAMSALATFAHEVLLDLRRTEAQQEAAERDDAVAEWLTGVPEVPSPVIGDATLAAVAL